MTPRRPSKTDRLLEEIRFVPWWGYLAATLILLALMWLGGGWYLTKLRQVYPNSPAIQTIQPPVVAACLWIWFVMIFYVGRDAGRRRMSVPLWTLLVIVIPSALGFIVYFLARDPIPSSCPRCAAAVRAEFVFCPSCGASLTRACPQCHRPVEAGWSSCAFCGARLETPRLEAEAGG